MARPVLALVSRAEARRRLAISDSSFARHWNDVFTDPRPAHLRHVGVARTVFEDELTVAVVAGGGRRGRIAVLNYRGRIRRIEAGADVRTEPAGKEPS